MERKFVALLCAGVLVASGLIGAAAFAYLVSPFLIGTPPGSGVHVTLDSGRIGGEPGQNTSTIWVARITAVSSNESLDRYEAALFLNDTREIGPVPLVRGTLGTAGDLVFDFFEEGVYCSPTPCPPPEGPDGRLGVGDYFRISKVSPATTYAIEVVWAETGEIVGRITIST